MTASKKQIITNKENAQKYIRANCEMTKDRAECDWIAVDKDNLKITVKRLPERGDIAIPIKEQLIVELYSK